MTYRVTYSIHRALSVIIVRAGGKAEAAAKAHDALGNIFVREVRAQ